MAVQPSTLRTTSQTAGRLYPDRSSRRRTVEAVAFVGVWMMAGYLLHLSSDAYLLLGIPLTIGFQVLVRRRPLREPVRSHHNPILVGQERFRSGGRPGVGPRVLRGSGSG